ncbi:hypothetical protein ACJJTC_019701 [Scirpophaga incertulas]
MVHGAARVAAVLTAARGARWPAWCMVPHGTWRAVARHGAARVAAVLTAARGARWPTWCRTGSGKYSPQHVARGGPHGAARVAAVLTAARGARWPAWCMVPHGVAAVTHRSTWRAVARMVPHG